MYDSVAYCVASTSTYPVTPSLYLRDNSPDNKSPQ